MFTVPTTLAIYALSLHDALPICLFGHVRRRQPGRAGLCHGVGPATATARHQCRGAQAARLQSRPDPQDRKSTRLNSSHVAISYAVFCLKKKISIYTFNSPILYAI